MIVFQFNAVDSRPFQATIQILSIPFQIALHTFLLDGGVEEFIIEEAFIEIGACLCAATCVMWLHRPSGIFGVIIGAILSLLLIIPTGRLLINHYDGVFQGWWYVLLGLCFINALTNWIFLLEPMAAGVVSASDQNGIRKRLLHLTGTSNHLIAIKNPHLEIKQ